MDTLMTARPAKTVVYRHSCDCATASVSLEPGQEAEHRFDVDGEPFPWLITDDGATFFKRGEHYLVSVRILPFHLDVTATTFRHAGLESPTLGDRIFPWPLAGPMVYTVDPDLGYSVLELTFIADHVDVDCDVTDITPLRR